MQQASLHRGAGAKPVRNENGLLIDYDYYLSDKAKGFVRTREESGDYGAGYFIDRSICCYHDADREWSTADVVRDPFSVAVSSQLLPFDVFDLPPPDSDPDIHQYYEKFSIPPESK